MLEIDKLSKETVYNIMLKQLLAAYYHKFTLVNFIETHNPELSEGQEIMKLIEDYVAYEAKGLSGSLNIPLDSIDNLVKLLKVSHWAILESCEIEKLTDTSCRMRIIGCSTQKSADKWYGKEFKCATPTMAALRGFCRQSDKSIQINPVFSPFQDRPEGAPENVSCEWIFSIV